MNRRTSTATQPVVVEEPELTLEILQDLTVHGPEADEIRGGVLGKGLLSWCGGW